MAVILVKSIEAARRQLETAIALLFSAGDVVAVHTLASAAGRILIRLAEDKTTWPDPRAFVRPGREVQFAELMARTTAFFQYPDEDIATLLDGVQEEVNDLMLFQACHWYEALGNPLPPAMGAFTAWFVVMYADLFVDDHPFKQRVPAADLAWLRGATRAQQLAFGQKLLTANRPEMP